MQQNLNKELKNKMASLPQASLTEDTDISKSIDFISEEYDDMKSSQRSMEKELKRLSTKLEGIGQKVYAIDKAIEDMYMYSYQYNVKIFGIPQRGPRESATESADICLNLFNKLGATSISLSDIDIAHRIPNRRPSSFPPAIICKFTRRLAKEQVMNRKKEAARVNVFDITGASSQIRTRIQILDHLTPRSQEIFKKAKEFQNNNEYKYCWTKNSVIYLKKDNESATIRVTGTDVLDNL